MILGDGFLTRDGFLRRVALPGRRHRTTPQSRPGRPRRSDTGGTTASRRTCRRSASAARAAGAMARKKMPVPSRTAPPSPKPRYLPMPLSGSSISCLAYATTRSFNSLIVCAGLSVATRLLWIERRSLPLERCGRNLRGRGPGPNRMASPDRYRPVERPGRRGRDLGGRERVVGDEREAQVLVVVHDTGQTGDVVDVRGLRAEHALQRLAGEAARERARRPGHRQRRG